MKTSSAVILISTIIFLLLTNLMFAQYNGWMWQYPLPHGNGLSDIAPITENRAVAIGHEIMLTTDRGVTWVIKLSLNVNLGSIDFIDQNTGWIVGGEGTIIKTTDGGENWEFKNFSEPVPFLSVDFIDQNTGWAVGGAETIIKTTDGGNSWIEQTSGTNVGLRSVYFIDDSIGWIVGDQGTALKTTNGGDTWTAVTVFPGFMTGHSVFFTDYNTGYIIDGPLSRVFKTTDGGITWIPNYPGSYPSFESIFFSDMMNGWIGGSNGTILKTTNGGNSWINQSYTTNGDIRRVYAIDSLNVWAVGGPILTSTDGGESWTNRRSGLMDVILRDVYFVDENFGCSVGRNGKVLRTTNGGEGWTIGTSGSTADLNSVYFVNQNIGWTVGDAGTILKSADGGQTWITQSSGTPEELFSVYFIDSLIGWVGGDSGTPSILLKTTDGGITWNRIFSPPTTGYIKSVNFCNQDTGWAIEKRNILKTSDGGSTWTVKYNINNISLQTSDFIGCDLVWAAGYNPSIEQGLILKTPDGGITWTEIILTHGIRGSISFADLNNGIITLGYDRIYRTTDGGDFWFFESLPTGNQINSVHFYNQNNTWIAGGGILYQNQFTPKYVSVIQPNGGEVLMAGNLYNISWSSANVEKVNIFLSTDNGIGWISVEDSIINTGMYEWVVPNYPSSECLIKISSINDQYVSDQSDSVFTIDNVTDFNDLSSPTDYALFQNFPNPFNSNTLIKYSIPKRSAVTLDIFNLLGEKILELVNEPKEAGYYQVNFDFVDFSSGVYFYRLQSGSFVDIKKMIYLK